MTSSKPLKRLNPSSPPSNSSLPLKLYRIDLLLSSWKRSFNTSQKPNTSNYPLDLVNLITHYSSHTANFDLYDQTRFTTTHYKYNSIISGKLCDNDSEPISASLIDETKLLPSNSVEIKILQNPGVIVLGMLLAYDLTVSYPVYPIMDWTYKGYFVIIEKKRSKIHYKSNFRAKVEILKDVSKVKICDSDVFKMEYGLDGMLKWFMNGKVMYQIDFKKDKRVKR